MTWSFCTSTVKYEKEKPPEGGKNFVTPLKPRKTTVKKTQVRRKGLTLTDVNTLYKKPKQGSRKRKKEVAKPTVDININNIDHQIKQTLTGNGGYLEPNTETKTIVREISNLHYQYEESDCEVEKMELLNRVKHLRFRLWDIEEGFDLGWYLLRTRGYLKNYKALSSVVSFVNVGGPSKNIEKIDLTVAYLSIAQNYLPTLSGYISSLKKGLQCPNPDCKGKEFIEEEAVYICKACFTELEILDKNSTYKDTSRINLATRYKYTRRQHFIEAKLCFEGKQNKQFPQSIFDLIEREMNFYGITKEALTKDQIFMFLSDAGKSGYYDDINALHFRITGKPLPDISKYDQKLLEYHDMIDECFERTKFEGRINSLNVHFKIMMTLKLLGYECSSSDFFSLKTETKIQEHNEVWQKLMELCGLPYIP